jgi:hypothetical protein
MMKCPVCGEDCVQYAHDLLDTLDTVFAPCPACTPRILDKQKPPPADAVIMDACTCEKRFIDDVFVEVYSIMVQEGLLAAGSPLRDAGIPLVHPGFAMTQPPYLPRNSLLLLSRDVDKKTADRLMREVPELRGVVKCGDFTPGAEDVNLTAPPRVYELLAGCDVRADIFYTQHSPVILYKQQSLTHIEFPRGYDPKIVSVGVQLRHAMPKVFVDASSGVGTLGILGAISGVRHVILNDAWYAAAYWSAYNVEVNREHLLVGPVRFLKEYGELQEHPVLAEPLKVAEAEGAQKIEVYQGDFRRLGQVIPKEKSLLAVIDLFRKSDPEVNRRILQEWRERVGGEAFIP